MKMKITYILVASISLLLISCKDSKTNSPVETVPGLESVNGVVTNEDGEVLEGIKIEVYYDEKLTKHYPNDDWYLLSDEDKKVYADKEPVVYTDKDGAYRIADVARGEVETLDVYVVATDISNVYQSQIQKGQIKYVKVLVVDDTYAVGGETFVNFIMKKEK